MGGDPGKSGGAAPGTAQAAAPPPNLADLAEYGRGAYDPVTGLHEWYDLPPGHPARPADPRQDTGRPSPGLPSWETVLAEWEPLEADLAELYPTVDWTPRTLRRHTARWFRVRIAGVLSANTRTARRLGTYQRRPADPLPLPLPRR